MTLRQGSEKNEKTQLHNHGAGCFAHHHVFIHGPEALFCGQPFRADRSRFDLHRLETQQKGIGDSGPHPDRGGRLPDYLGPVPAAGELSQLYGNNLEAFVLGLFLHGRRRLLSIPRLLQLCLQLPPDSLNGRSNHIKKEAE